MSRKKTQTKTKETGVSTATRETTIPEGAMLEVVVYERLKWLGERASDVPLQLRQLGQLRYLKLQRYPDIPTDQYMDWLRNGYYEIDGYILTFPLATLEEYHGWLENLALTIWKTSLPEVLSAGQYQYKPFRELFGFGPSYGVIGPDTADKLADDFVDYADNYGVAESERNFTLDDLLKYLPYSKECDMITLGYSAYTNLRLAFQLAARGGGVVAFC